MSTSDGVELDGSANVATLVRENRHLRSWPMVSPKLALDDVVDRLVLLEFPDEFTWSPCMDSEFVSRLVFAGFLPMSTMARLDSRRITSVLLPKIHLFRCVANPATIHISKKARKRSKRFTVTTDTCFNDVAENCRKQHGRMCWLSKALQTAFEGLNAVKSPVTCHTIEIWEGENLVAGEIGTVCGGIYCSLTAFTSVDSSGTIQMCCLAKILESSGFRMWDMGMSLDYKMDIGASEIPRSEFIQKFRLLRDKCTYFPEIQERVKCDNIITQGFSLPPVDGTIA